MMKVRELAKKMHISVRTLHYYDEIGLLKPELRNKQGFRVYGEADEVRLKMILGFRELGFSLKKTEQLLSMPPEERNIAIEQQIETLEQQRQRIENRIALARGIQMLGSRGFQEIDMHNLDAQMESAREFMDQSADIRLFREKTKDYAQEEWEKISRELIRRFAAVGNCEDEAVKAMIADFACFVDEHLFPCDDRILTNYAKMFGGDGVFGRKANEAGGPNTAERACRRVIDYIESK